MKEIISMFRDKGYLLSPDLLNMNSNQLQTIYSKVKFNPFKLKILDKSFIEEIELLKPSFDRNLRTFVEVIKQFEQEEEKRVITSFVEMYNNRFEKISAYLRNRTELSNVLSARTINEDRNLNNLGFIGMVADISYTKNNNILITLEDPTGSVKTMITEKDADLYNKAQEIVLDEVIGITGSKSRGYIFAKQLFFPEVPNTYEFKKSSDEVYAVFISDIHIGSTDFMEESFIKFLDWISGKTGSSEQAEIASKVGYLFIVGDVVDGVGVYPSQENDLVVKDVYEQFRIFIKFLKRIPENVQIIICPGNHDAVRIAEPQPPFSKEFVEELYGMKNVTLVSNPAYIRIHSVNGSPGFIVLMYHGYSFDHYCLDVQPLRNAGGYGAVEKVVEFLLRKRHLAPTHGSTLVIPSSNDNLVIEPIPDIVVTGHIHALRTKIFNHMNIICCSCFQRTTGETYAERLGHTPTPAVVPILNLKTRKVSVMDFK